MEEKPKRGRPPKWTEIDPEQVRSCAMKMWKISEIAAFFRVSHDTIERHFASIIEEARQTGYAKIRDLQWKRAIEGSDTMIKHISEHYLGQHAKSEIKNETTLTATVEQKAAMLTDEQLKERMKKLEEDV